MSVIHNTSLYTRRGTGDLTLYLAPTCGIVYAYILVPHFCSFGACVACGHRAEAFCSGCRVTPYCSPACQRRDWAERHKNTCHNLKRPSVGVSSRLDIEHETPAAAPLRRPRSPDPSPRDAGNDRFPPRKFGPPGIATTPTPAAKSYNNSRNAGGHNRPGQGSDADKGPSDRSRFNRSNDDDNRPNAHPNDRKRDNITYGRKNEDRSDRSRNQDGGNRTYGQSRQKEDEDWGPKPSEKPTEPKPAPKPSPVPKEQPSPKVAPTAAAASPGRPIASVAEVAPVLARKPSAPVQIKPAPAQTKPSTPALVPKKFRTLREFTLTLKKNSRRVRNMWPETFDTCVIDTLALKETFMLTADTPAEGSGFICVSLHEDHTDNYDRLLDPLSKACEASEACEPRPGETFAYLDPADGCSGGWYRARCLAPTRAALLDAARIATLTPKDQCRRLHADYAVIPEFCCQLESDQVQLKDQVQCTVVSKSGSDLSVSITNLETGIALGFGTVRRWLPAVEWPQEVAAAATASCARPEAPRTEPAPSSAPAARATAPSEPPQVPRPAVTAGTVYLLVDATEPSRLFVRPAELALQAEFNDVLCEVAMYGADESTPRLTELPTAGQTVVARFTDGNHYRALVQRVSSKNRRCLLEYIEYGNAAAVDLQSLCPCPPQLDAHARPTLTSAVTLHMNQKTFSPAATAYLDKLKDDEEKLTLTIPSGETSGPNKTPVRLTVVKSGEDVNRTVDTLSTPDWQKLLERGGDVLETETMIFQQITYVDLPDATTELDIFDCSLIEHGVLSGHARAADHAKRAHALAVQLNEYCNSALAKDPYTPNCEELCIAMCPNKKQWLRAVLLEQIGGPGGAEAHILFYDYGHMLRVPIASLRKMMPEFARGIPAAAVSLVIKDFPREPTEAQQAVVRRELQLDGRGVGTLRVVRVHKRDVAEYIVDAPELLHKLV